jgi:uncharacterized protein (TIGR00369 family)
MKIEGYEMARAERTTELVRLFHERAPIARFFGMHLSYNEEGGAVIDLPYNPNLDHALGGVHGGVYATMLDTAGWFTVAATTDRSCWVATSEFTVHLLQPVQRTSLRSVGRLVKVGKRQAVAEMRLEDGEGRLVGHGVGTFIVLPNVPTK